MTVITTVNFAVPPWACAAVGGCLQVHVVVGSTHVQGVAVPRRAPSRRQLELLELVGVPRHAVKKQTPWGGGASGATATVTTTSTSKQCDTYSCLFSCGVFFFSC
jgi:hypothetical protein